MANNQTHMWEITLDQWDDIREELRRRLIKIARRKSTLSYSDLAEGLPFEGPHSHALRRMLEEIGQDCDANDEPLLSALAVYATGDKRGDPGDGFYGALIRLRRIASSTSKDERYEYWVGQVGLCHQFNW